MSYEFRSPMNSILGLTEVLISDEVDASRRHHLEVIRESGNSLLKLINDILDTSKLESQSLPLDVSEFSLVQLCRQIELYPVKPSRRGICTSASTMTTPFGNNMSGIPGA